MIDVSDARIASINYHVQTDEVSIYLQLLSIIRNTIINQKKLHFDSEIIISYYIIQFWAIL